MKALVAIAATVMLAGCASNGLSSRPSSCASPSSDQQLSLNLADDMTNDGRLYASLANLEGLPDNLVQVRLRKARILRLLGRNDAEPLYQGLLGTCLAAEGEHGLGQLAAARNDNAAAMEHLERAKKMAPTDEKIRNDLGVVYLNQQRINEARFEFLTAMELKQSDSLAALNMVTLLIYQDNWKQAAELANRANLSPKQVTDAQTRAARLKTPGKKALVSEGSRTAEVVDASTNAIK
ncbi:MULTISPECIES: tetratricopeptide repeat protein [Pseudomonas]|uniref:Tetratricopeptide repeat protein n=1 Tax=Pseudomonas gingeri TaxID=117681 RepID=A0A7Y7WS76_9PSED|nr:MULTISPECIES: tetratricopeptide repeat protein [Pseudomonas]MPQ65923.1 tetratricopeptide repeat protein [Pseudomonas sp. MWU12-2323]NWB86750.1 tetratricopeptide repeat protein [Pseudomonas gingeri]